MMTKTASADVAVCWTAEHVYAGVLLLFSMTYLRRAKWQKKKV